MYKFSEDQVPQDACRDYDPRIEKQAQSGNKEKNKRWIQRIPAQTVSTAGNQPVGADTRKHQAQRGEVKHQGDGQ